MSDFQTDADGRYGLEWLNPFLLKKKKVPKCGFHFSWQMMETWINLDFTGPMKDCKNNMGSDLQQALAVGSQSSPGLAKPPCSLPSVI